MRERESVCECECIFDMANSKYEYVKSFEVEDEVMFPNLVVVRIDGRDFRSFCDGGVS